MGYKVTITSAPANEYSRIWQAQRVSQALPMTLGEALDIIKSEFPSVDVSATDEERQMIVLNVKSISSSASRTVDICEWTYTRSGAQGPDDGGGHD